MYKSAEYEQAVAFRKRGFTYTEIARIVGVSKSTVSNWLRDQQFSQKIRDENAQRAARDNAKRMSLLNKARSAERTRSLSDVHTSAETEFRHYKKDPLFTAGLMLYLSAGATSDEHVIRLSSGRMEVHRIFMRFASEYLGAPREKIRFWLFLPCGAREQECMKKWMRETGVTIPQFYKNQFAPRSGKKRTLQYGVGNTIIASTVLTHKLNRWIELVERELKN